MVKSHLVVFYFKSHSRGGVWSPKGENCAAVPIFMDLLRNSVCLLLMTRIVFGLIIINPRLVNLLGLLFFFLSLSTLDSAGICQ